MFLYGARDLVRDGVQIERAPPGQRDDTSVECGSVPLNVTRSFLKFIMQHRHKLYIDR